MSIALIFTEGFSVEKERIFRGLRKIKQNKEF
jgi:hypothetical protein